MSSHQGAQVGIRGVVALDSLFHLGMGCLVFVPAKKKLHAVGTNEFFRVLRRVLRYYGGNTVPR
jgi:hypothetical protein